MVAPLPQATFLPESFLLVHAYSPPVVNVHAEDDAIQIEPFKGISQHQARDLATVSPVPVVGVANHDTKNRTAVGLADLVQPCGSNQRITLLDRDAKLLTVHGLSQPLYRLAFATTIEGHSMPHRQPDLGVVDPAAQHGLIVKLFGAKIDTVA